MPNTGPFAPALDTDEGALDTKEVVIALGPWSPDILEPLGIKLPLAVKRGYHRHYRPKGNAGLTRVIVDTENGYCLAPMEQGVRVTTGAEFANRIGACPRACVGIGAAAMLMLEQQMDKDRRFGREVWKPLLWAVLALCFSELFLVQWYGRGKK